MLGSLRQAFYAVFVLLAKKKLQLPIALISLEGRVRQIRLLHLLAEKILMKSKYATFLAVGLIWMVAGVDNAKAQCGNGFGVGFGLDVGRLYGVLADNVPHFAAFPPVYYSAPVPRTYGHSPFAYPPGTRTPEIVAPAPLEIINPHAMESIKASTSASNDKITLRAASPQPLVVLNPYATRPTMMNASNKGLGAGI